MTSDFAPDSVYSVLKAFQPFLKSIDIRTIAVRPQSGDEWKNLVTSIVVSEKSVDEVKKEQSKLPKLRNNQIALFSFAFPLDFQFFDGFVNGEIGRKWIGIITGGGYAYGTPRIKTRQFNPLDLKMVSEDRRIEGAYKWVLTAKGANSSPEREQLWAIVQDQAMMAKLHSYSQMNDLIKDSLGIENVSHNIDFQLNIFDLGKIENVTFGISSFEVEISKVYGLKNLQLNVLQGRSEEGRSHRNIWRTKISIDEIEAQQPQGLMTVSVQPPNLFPFDTVELELLHRGSVLTLDRTWRKAPLRKVVEPFLKTLDAFCPIEKLKKMLLEPKNCGREPDKRFENTVAWLLSLAGFNVVYLGAKIKVSKKNNLVSFDVLRNESGIPIGCADIIAYEDSERILLVDCDIGGIDPKKVQELIKTYEHFESLKEYQELKIVPVLFTPANIGDSMKKQPVAVIDGNAIESILEELAKGGRKSARSKITYFCPW